MNESDGEIDFFFFVVIDFLVSWSCRIAASSGPAYSTQATFYSSKATGEQGCDIHFIYIYIYIYLSTPKDSA